MQKIRVGIIGTGFGARVHAPWLRAHAGYDVRAIASVRRGDEERIRSDSGVDRVYLDSGRMLAEEELDLVVIASAPGMHRAMTLQALERGLHVLCEKPMALNAAQAQDMCDALERSGRRGFLNHEFRMRPGRLAVREIVEAGTLGELVHVRYFGSGGGYLPWRSRRLGWLGSREAGGGMLGAIGSHMLDSLHFWTGLDIAEVQAQLETLVPEANPDGGEVERRTADDSFRVIGMLAGGVAFSLGWSLTMAGPAGWHLDIQGTEGFLRLLDDERLFLAQGDDPLHEVPLPGLSPQPPAMAGPAARYPSLYPFLDRLYGVLSAGGGRPAASRLRPGTADPARPRRCARGGGQRPAHQGPDLILREAQSHCSHCKSTRNTPLSS